ncbi:MAG: nuclear transport factor 2 family protein [Gammaproteobacteria bacterium]|jgi:ketosteroid isomerase-like protein
MDDNERMLIEWACEKLVRKFAVYSDNNDFTALMEIFTEDAVYTRPMAPDTRITGRDAIHKVFLERPSLVIRHLTVNCLVDVVSAGEARGISYVMFLASHDTGGERPAVAPALHVGEYRDTFVRTDEGWKIRERYGSVTLKAP